MTFSWNYAAPGCWRAALAALHLLLAPASAQDGVETLPGKFAPGILLESSREVLRPGVDLPPVYGKGLKLTKVSEGWVPRLYNDAAGYCTIGYGHLIKKARCDGTEPAEFRAGITEKRGEELLVEDMRGAQVAVMNAVKRTMTEGQYAALVDFTFNVGATNFRSSTLLKVVNAGQLDRVPAQFRRWVLAGGKEWPGLKTRREREIELFFDGLPTPRDIPRADEAVSPLDIESGERP